MRDFDQLEVTIMVVIAQLAGNIDIDSIFPLLEITKVPLVESKRRSKRPKIPTCNIRGAILSARYRGVSRGIARESYFRNSILVDISNGDKNINIKLSRNSMHICGSKSIEMARDAVNLLLDKVGQAASFLSSFQERKEELIPQITKMTKGHPVFVEGRLRHRMAEATSDDELIRYLLQLAGEFSYHEDFLTHLDWMSQLDKVMELPQDNVRGTPQITELTKVMVNYNYELGFPIDRRLFVEAIDGINGFTASYENTLQHNVTVILPYYDPTRKAKKKTCHTFIVYRSGFVTQSGPDEVRMKQAYDLFRETIEKIRPIVEKV